jgi:beta-fructofuranosidase
MVHERGGTPDRFVWDFWYYFDPDTRLFHVLYLNADRSLVATNKHHFHSRLGYAATKDFISIRWVDDRVFTASRDGWDNTSIWTGDVIRIANGFLMFYTSRDGRDGDGMTQNIGLAFSDDMLNWRRLPQCRIAPHPAYYEVASVEGDSSIHAWRDPFVFRFEGQVYMVLAAKAKDKPPRSKGAIGLLRAGSGFPFVWEAMPPLLSPGWYGEMEVPQVYVDSAGGLTLVYSVHQEHDGAPGTGGVGGLHAFEVGCPESTAVEGSPVAGPTVLLPYSSGIYACRIAPELEGEIIGFDTNRGGFRRSGRLSDLRSADRDFSSVEISL